MRFLGLLCLAAISVVSLGAQDKIGLGTYKGTYAGGAGGGDFHLTLKVDNKGGIAGDVGFTIMGEEVVGKIN